MPVPLSKLGACFGAAACALLLAACQPQSAAAPDPRPVVAGPVRAATEVVSASVPGEVQARYSTPLSFRIAGKLIERNVRLGDSVKSGQLLARLDPADMQKNATSAQAQLEAAQHRLVFAQQQLERDRAQARENLIARAQLEQTEDAYASALAQRQQAAQQAGLAADQLRYASLSATHAGVITAEQAETGQNLSAGQPVYTLAWSGEVDVIGDVAEHTLAALSIGQPANVTLTALPGRVLKARVRELAPAADAQSRTWRVKLTLVQPGPEVRLGMTATIAFQPATAAATATTATAASASSAAAVTTQFLIPATALFHQGQQPAVWVVRADDTLVLRPIQVARYDASHVLVSSGLKDGERVVWQGVHTVSAGEKVRVIAPLHAEDFAS
nr:efflux RND transporter periplasmic adaptor subunit [Paraburkholderia bonniea]